MIETINKIRCDLCLKELDKKNRYRYKYEYLQRFLLILLTRANYEDFNKTHLCKDCYLDIKEFIDNHRIYYKLK